MKQLLTLIIILVLSVTNVSAISTQFDFGVDACEYNCNDWKDWCTNNAANFAMTYDECIDYRLNQTCIPTPDCRRCMVSWDDPKMEFYFGVTFNSAQECADYFNLPCSRDNEVPEFSTLAAAGLLAMAAGFVYFKRK